MKNLNKADIIRKSFELDNEQFKRFRAENQSPNEPIWCNTVVNTYMDYKEICIYKKGFTIRSNEEPLFVDTVSGEIVKRLIDRSPLLVPKEDGTFLVKAGKTIKDILASGKHSHNRALKNFYGYALANSWEYFVTITISSKYDRFDDNSSKELYSRFAHNVSRRFPGVKILCKPERHKLNKEDAEHTKGALHFHCLMADCNLMPYLTKYYKGSLKQATSKCGHLLYTLDLVDFGFTTVSIIPKTDNQQQVANYLVKYMVKSDTKGQSDDMGRFQKRFYHTRNLAFMDKEVSRLSDYQIKQLENELYSNMCAVKTKTNCYLTVYRIYNDYDHYLKSTPKNMLEKKTSK